MFAGGALLRAGDNSQLVEPTQRPTRPALVCKVGLDICDWKIMLLVRLVCTRFTCKLVALCLYSVTCGAFIRNSSWESAVNKTCILICLEGERGRERGGE